jgi:hypothetical protein
LQENANYAVIEFIWKLFCFKIFYLISTIWLCP